MYAPEGPRRVRRLDSFSRGDASGPLDLTKLVQPTPRKRTPGEPPQVRKPNLAASPLTSAAAAPKPQTKAPQTPASRLHRRKRIIFFAATIPAVLSVVAVLSKTKLFVHSQP